MMKVVLYTIVLMALVHSVNAQIPVPDTVGIHRDTVPPSPRQDFPVLSDTTQYNDTTISNTASGKDTTVKKRVHSPRKATIRSLIVPGLGQIYNRKYWKVPVVYAAIGTPMYLFFYNRTWFNRIKYALTIVANDRTNNLDSMASVHPDLKALVELKAQGPLVDYRNSYRKDMDYSILFTILMWGLNVVDATVDAHLKEFDVSEDLSMKIKPALIAGTNTPGLAVVVRFK